MSLTKKAVWLNARQARANLLAKNPAALDSVVSEIPGGVEFLTEESIAVRGKPSVGLLEEHVAYYRRKLADEHSPPANPNTKPASLQIAFELSRELGLAHIDGYLPSLASVPGVTESRQQYLRDLACMDVDEAAIQIREKVPLSDVEALLAVLAKERQAREPAKPQPPPRRKRSETKPDEEKEKPVADPIVNPNPAPAPVPQPPPAPQVNLQPLQVEIASMRDSLLKQLDAQEKRQAAWAQVLETKMSQQSANDLREAKRLNGSLETAIENLGQRFDNLNQVLVRIANQPTVVSPAPAPTAPPATPSTAPHVAPVVAEPVSTRKERQNWLMGALLFAVLLAVITGAATYGIVRAVSSAAATSAYEPPVFEPYNPEPVVAPSTNS